MLETIWFLLWGILWAVYFMLDGYDLGLGTLMPFMAKTEADRKQIYGAMGPHWDGNEVWLITAGGVTFAAFPTTYAVMFSGLYTALMLILFALILRGVSFVFQGGVDSPGWRKLWDTCLAVGSFLPALLLGVAFANIFQGLPLDKEGIFQGTLFTLLNPYGLLGGLLFLFLFLVHGATWGAIKTSGDLQQRLADTAGKLWWILLVTAVMFLLATLRRTDLYDNYLQQTGAVCHPGPGRGRLAPGKILSAKGPVLEGLVCFGGHHRLLHPVWGDRFISPAAALQPQPGLQPHGL